MAGLNPEVTTFLASLELTRREEIEMMRRIILTSNESLEENIKWNAPNYAISQADLITMRIMPNKHFQLILHRGAKLQSQPKERLINDETGLLDWKANDRAVITFKNMAHLLQQKENVVQIIKEWIKQ